MPIAYRESIQRPAVGERKYIRYFDDRGHFAHLRLLLVPQPGKICSVTGNDQLQIPLPCYHSARTAIFKRLEAGPIRRFPMFGFEVQLLTATYMPKYSYPEAFAIVACMALDSALAAAAAVVLEPWIGLRLKVEPHALSDVLTTLTEFVGEADVAVSHGEYFLLKAQVPVSLAGSIQRALGLNRLDTFRLSEALQYRPILRELPPMGPTQSRFGDWT